MTVQLNFGHGEPPRRRPLRDSRDDRHRRRQPAAAEIIDHRITARSTPDSPATAVARPNSNKQLRDYFADHADATKRDRIALANLEERLDVITQKFPTMVMDIADKPRETFILNRGDYSQPTEKVTAGTPAVLPPLPAGAPANRLGLAQWITMREHPLTARVEVNRLWQIFFGTGLVATAADFGAQGEYPSHPELLDWLAVDFMDNGWDVKRLIKKIVTSATYRQSSTVAESPRLGPSVRRHSATRSRSPKPPPRPRPALPPPAEFIRDECPQSQRPLSTASAARA